MSKNLIPVKISDSEVIVPVETLKFLIGQIQSYETDLRMCEIPSGENHCDNYATKLAPGTSDFDPTHMCDDCYNKLKDSPEFTSVVDLEHACHSRFLNVFKLVFK